jgi:hypothetical protein
MDGRYIDQRVRLEERIGDASQTVPGNFLSIFSGGGFDANHKGNGIAYLTSMFFAPETKFRAQAFPLGIVEVSAVTRPDDIYDWRQDSTAIVAIDEDGSPVYGSGTQRRATPSTWGPCDNPVVNFVHLEWFRWGRSWDRCIAPRLTAHSHYADICDDAIPLVGGGTEKRYTCAGWYIDTPDRNSIRAKLAATMDGWWTYVRGELILKCGVYEAPTFTLTGDYIEEGSTWSRGVTRDQRVSALTITFTDPNSKYGTNSPDTWPIADNGGQVTSLALEWVTSWTQSRRLAKRKAAQVNPAYSGQIKCGPIGFLGLGYRYIRLQNDNEDSMADVVVEVTNAEFDPATGQFIYDVISADPNIDTWTPATEEGTSPVIITTAAAQVLPQPTISSATAEYVEYADGTFGVAVAISADSTTTRSDLSWYASWKLHSASIWNDGSVQSGDGAGLASLLIPGPLPANTLVDVSVEYVTGGTSPSSRSATTTVDTSTSSVAPGPPTITTAAAGGTGSITASWQNPTSTNLAGTRVYRGAHGAAFSTATDISGLRMSGIGAPDADTITGQTAGTYDVWLASENASGTKSPPVGPQTVTVT